MSGKRSLRFGSERDMPAPMRALYEAQLRRMIPAAPGAATEQIVTPGRRNGRATVEKLLSNVKVLTTNIAASGSVRQVEMNKTEARYAQHLEGRRIAGEVEWYAFEALKLRLADRTFYTPDFAVMLSTGAMECHEVKGGHWEDDARVKIKVAARMFPMRFFAFQRRKGEWYREAF
jgi:hypothetical protein